MSGDTLEFAQVMAVIVLSTASFIGIGLVTRILWNWGSRSKGRALPAHDDERMQRLETAVDTIAIEVERISEAQRFMVTLLSDALPARVDRAELPGPGSHRPAITPH